MASSLIYRKDVYIASKPCYEILIIQPFFCDYGKQISVGKRFFANFNVTIGDNVTIGAGSVVTKDIPANSIAVGNPCRVIKNIR